MYEIFKMSPSPTVDFAAEELRKYFYMMMPDDTNVVIEYNKEAKECMNQQQYRKL